jgi:serine/threonine protein kinase
MHKVRNEPLSGSSSDEYISDFVVSGALLKHGLINDPELREQLEQTQVPSSRIGFVEHLLTVDPKQRPSVTEALAHPYLRNQDPEM